MFDTGLVPVKPPLVDNQMTPCHIVIGLPFRTCRHQTDQMYRCPRWFSWGRPVVGAKKRRQGCINSFMLFSRMLQGLFLDRCCTEMLLEGLPVSTEVCGMLSLSRKTISISFSPSRSTWVAAVLSTLDWTWWDCKRWCAGKPLTVQ